MQTNIKECRSCGANKLIQVVDLGEQYVSDFRKDKSKPNKYPLRAVICDGCKLVQLDFTTPSQEMYHTNYGFKSGISTLASVSSTDEVSPTPPMR